MAIIILRTFIIYFVIMLTMRILGKRQLGEMELSEFVLASLAADLVSQPLQDIEIPMINGLVPVLTLFCTEVILTGVTLKSSRFRAVAFGKPSIIIKNGKICQKAMIKNRLTLDELTQRLRAKSCLDISTVEYAVLETDGTMSIILFPDKRPLSVAQAGADPGKGGYPRTVISDGRVIDENLISLGLNRNWLNKKLNELGENNPERVFLLSVDEYGQTYYAVKEKEN